MSRFSDIRENFEFLDEWEDRYAFVIELGRELAPMEDALKTADTKVDGCASQVWIFPTVDGRGDDAQITFKGDSDAMIVKGLIALLHALYDGQSAKFIEDTDALKAFAELGLDKHLSAQRSNGLRAMVSRLKSIAAAARAA